MPERAATDGYTQRHEAEGTKRPRNVFPDLSDRIDPMGRGRLAAPFQVPLGMEGNDMKTTLGKLRLAADTEEAFLWEHLRGRRQRGWKFRHLHNFGRGVIATFWCPKAKLAVAMSKAEARVLCEMSITCITITSEQVRADPFGCVRYISEWLPRGNHSRSPATPYQERRFAWENA